MFMGIMIDTGASQKSTAGHGQLMALRATNMAIQMDTLTKGQVSIQFGIGIATLIGTICIDSPIGTIQFHVIEANMPFLLCFADMDNLKVYYNNLRNVLVTYKGEVPVAQRFGHPILLWDTSLQCYLTESFNMNPCYLTDTELRRLHRRFGHPTVEQLQRLLDKSGHDVDKSILKNLKKY